MTTKFAGCAACAALGLTLFVGCGEKTHQVRGTITWQGQPVPVGVVQFEPSKDLGDAPTGFAVIKDGRFATEPLRGCLPGPHIARIKGFDGKLPPLPPAVAAERIAGYDDEPSLETGTPLFDETTLAVDIAQDAELRIELPNQL
jgi:hypothetical protein